MWPGMKHNLVIIIRKLFRCGVVRHEATSIPCSLFLQREVRAHFNCSSLVGAELENQGGQGAARMHWEKRIFGVRGGREGVCVCVCARARASVRACVRASERVSE